MNRLLALILLSGALALPALFATGACTPNPSLRGATHAAAPPDLFLALTASEVKAALATGADPDARIGADGFTPLHMTAAQGNRAVIAALIEGGADPDARTEGGFTPLHLAAGENANPSVIMALIEGGADPGARDKGGFTPLHTAAGHNFTKRAALRSLAALP